MPPMNFFDGVVRADAEGGMVFEEGTVGGARKMGQSLVAGQKDRENSASGGAIVQDGGLTLPGNGFRLRVPERLREALAGRIGQRVALGIRPEHFHLRPVEDPGASAPLEMKLNVIEPLGNDMDIYMETNLHDHVVGRVEASSGLREDSRLTMYVDLRKIHFFEPGDTGMNLSLSQGLPKEPAHALA
jgi:ABC-type sugar transport system ATPase subunit